MALKQVCVGSGGVGKSCIIIQFITGKFVEDYDPTLEDSYRKTIDIDEQPTVLDIYDTAGQEDFRAVRDSYLRMGDGFVVVFSLTSRKSFDEAKSLYDYIYKVKDLTEGEKFPFVLLGNKCDIPNPEVLEDEALALAKQWQCPFFSTSAKSRINIPDGFISLARQIRDYGGEDDSGGESPSTGGTPGPRRKRACLLF